MVTDFKIPALRLDTACVAQAGTEPVDGAPHRLRIIRHWELSNRGAYDRNHNQRHQRESLSLQARDGTYLACEYSTRNAHLPLLFVGKLA